MADGIIGIMPTRPPIKQNVHLITPGTQMSYDGLMVGEMGHRPYDVQDFHDRILSLPGSKGEIISALGWIGLNQHHLLGSHVPDLETVFPRKIL